MTGAPSRDPARCMRHRPPALLLATVEQPDPERLVARGVDDGPWRWARVLEGCAQAAGLLAGLQPGGPDDTAVIAEYRDVVLHARAHAGPVRFDARLDRRLLRFWRCRVEARADDGTLLLAGLVTVAPEPGA